MNGYRNNDNPSNSPETNGQTLKPKRFRFVDTLMAKRTMDSHTPLGASFTDKYARIDLVYFIPKMGKNSFFHVLPHILFDLIPFDVNFHPRVNRHVPPQTEYIDGNEKSNHGFEITSDHLDHLKNPRLFQASSVSSSLFLAGKWIPH